MRIGNRHDPLGAAFPMNQTKLNNMSICEYSYRWRRYVVKDGVRLWNVYLKDVLFHKTGVGGKMQ